MSSPRVANPARIVRRVRVGDEPALRAARERSADLAALGEAGLAAPVDLVEVGNGVVEARYRVVPGDDVAAVAAAHGRFSIGQCVWLGAAALRTLAAMHAVGHAHGDVSPANIMVSRAGPVLVDLVAGSGERGTPGFAAPERAVSATAAGDVYSLGKVLESVVDDDGATRLRAWTAPMTAPDPGSRPDAATAARALAMCAEPAPIAVPELDPAGLLRTRAAVAAEDAGTERDPAAWAWRLERAVVRAGRGALVAAGIGAVTWLGVLAVGALVPESPPGYDPPLPVDEARIAAPPAEAATALLESRIAALDGADAEALVSLTLEGSAAREEAQLESAALAAGTVAYDGLDAAVASVEVQSFTEDRAVVAVTYDVATHTRWVDGTAERVTARVERLEIALRWTPRGWLIERLRALP